jgi:primary-amine oxidase
MYVPSVLAAHTRDIADIWQKDSEIHAASPWNAYSPWDPLINFGEYFDGESLDQEDLVLWFNLGMHHVPHTGDLPNVSIIILAIEFRQLYAYTDEQTVFTTAQSAMVFTPHNYILGDASRDTSQLIRINFDEDKATDVETFGQEPISGDVNLAQVAWDPYNYYGDLTTRKFPYDGLNKDGEDKRK